MNLICQLGTDGIPFPHSRVTWLIKPQSSILGVTNCYLLLVVGSCTFAAGV